MYKVNIRKVEEKDKKFLHEIIGLDDSKVEKASFNMLGLELLNQDELLARMIKADARIFDVDGKYPFAVIEVVPYEKDTLEVRMISLINKTGEDRISQITTEKFIIDLLEEHGAKRVIMEVSLKSSVIIKNLIASGYRVISIINETVTLEFDYTNLNKLNKK